MKVLAINGSARIEDNTSLLIYAVCEELKREGIETVTIGLTDCEIAPCKGCFACSGHNNCAFSNDGFTDIFTKMTEADGIILGSPAYSADVSGIMKVFLERAGVVAATNPGILRHKVGVAVAAVRRAGGLTAIDTLPE